MRHIDCGVTEAVLGRRHDESYINRAMVAAYSGTALAPSTLWASSNSHNIDHRVLITPVGALNYVRSADEC